MKAKVFVQKFNESNYFRVYLNTSLFYFATCFAICTYPYQEQNNEQVTSVNVKYHYCN